MGNLHGGDLDGGTEAVSFPSNKVGLLDAGAARVMF